MWPISKYTYDAASLRKLGKMLKCSLVARIQESKNVHNNTWTIPNSLVQVCMDQPNSANDKSYLTISTKVNKLNLEHKPFNKFKMQ